MKKLISLALAVLLVSALIPATLLSVGAEPAVYDGSSVSASLTGTGTEAAPYLIANGADLAFFAQKISALTEADSAFYKLTADIVWSSYTSSGAAPAASNWTPIAGNFFAGTFDGDGHYISGIYIDNELATGTGLFASINGTLKNLTLKDSYIAANSHAGSFVGIINEGMTAVLTNLTSYANVTCKLTNGYSGGIVGRVYKATDAAVTDCVNYGKVESKAGNGYIGGIVGELNGALKAVVKDCANYGDIVGVTALIGGVVGSAGNSTATVTYATNPIDITDCFNAGKITGERIVGGIIGRANRGVNITNCVNIGAVEITSAADGDEKIKGFGGIGGSLLKMSEDAAVTNCYYLIGADKNISDANAVSATNSHAGITGKTEAELKGTGIVTALALNSGFWQDGGDGEYLALKITVTETPDTFDAGIAALCVVSVLSFASIATVATVICRRKATRS